MWKLENSTLPVTSFKNTRIPPSLEDLPFVTLFGGFIRDVFWVNLVSGLQLGDHKVTWKKLVYVYHTLNGTTDLIWCKICKRGRAVGIFSRWQSYVQFFKVLQIEVNLLTPHVYPPEVVFWKNPKAKWLTIIPKPGACWCGVPSKNHQHAVCSPYTSWKTKNHQG